MLSGLRWFGEFTLQRKVRGHGSFALQSNGAQAKKSTASSFIRGWAALRSLGRSGLAELIERPTLPGCFSDGKTIEEARRSIREAVEQNMTSLRNHGQAIPQDDRLVHVEELTVGVPE